MRPVLVLSIILALTGAALAQAQSLALELNAVQPSEKGCRFTFVVNNALGAEVNRAAFEIALFDSVGVVDRLTVLEFKGLPEGRTKVSRFELSGVDCAKVGRLLVNAVTACEGEGLTPQFCESRLKAGSKTGNVNFGT